MVARFVVIGAMKAGTTWVDALLREASDAAMPRGVKELFFFDHYWARGASWYESHWRGAPAHAPLGEVASTYYASAEAPERLASLSPRAQVVVILRDPGTRSWSHYRHLLRKGDIHPSMRFEDAVQVHPEILQWSRYGTLLAPWSQVFGDRLTALMYEELSHNPRDFARRLGAMLSLSIHQEMIQEGAVNVAREPRFYSLSRVAARTSHGLHKAGFHRVVELAKGARVDRLLERHKGIPDDGPPLAVRRLVWDSVGGDAATGAIALGLDPGVWNDPGRL